MRLSARIKSFFKSKGIPVRVSSSTHFIQCWIEWENREKYTFPIDYREEMLKIVYGEKFDPADKGSAGNIRSGMLAMTPGQWEKFLENK